MRRLLPYLLLMIALVFQTTISVGAVAMEDASPMEHCAGHVAADEDCTCCPEGAMAMTSCAVQCSSVQQAPATIIFAVNATPQSADDAFVQRSIRDPAYTPLIPPPIA